MSVVPIGSSTLPITLSLPQYSTGGSIFQGFSSSFGWWAKILFYHPCSVSHLLLIQSPPDSTLFAIIESRPTGQLMIG